MFGARKAAQHSAADYRAHKRRAANGVEMRIGGIRYSVLDYSEGGARIIATRERPPRVSIVELYLNGRSIGQYAAVMAWMRNGQVGYAFRKDQTIRSVEQSKPTPGHAYGASSIRNRLRM